MIKDANEITKEVNEKFDDEFQPLFSRMDEDLEVWEMSPSPVNLTAYHADILSKTKLHGSDLTIVSNELRTTVIMFSLFFLRQICRLWLGWQRRRE